MRKAETKRHIHLKVKELADQKGLSDLELAHKAQVDVRVIRRMFAGQQTNQILLNQVARVAEALEVPTCELIEDVSQE